MTLQILIGAPSSAPPRPAPAKGVLDVVVDGFNLTARVGAGQTRPFVRDLAFAAADLATGARSRATVRFYQSDDAWELGLVRDGGDVLLTVYRNGGVPEVAVYERRAPGALLVEGVRTALDELLRGSGAAGPASAELAYARSRLDSPVPWSAACVLPAASVVQVTPAATGSLALSASLVLRAAGGEDGGPVERADVLSLLVRGRLCVTAHGDTREVGDAFVFVVAERLVALATEALAAAHAGTALQRREVAGGARIGVRLEASGTLALSLRAAGAPGAECAGETTPDLDAASFGRATLAFGRALARSLARHDRTQRHNLRFGAFRRSLRALAAALDPQAPYGTRLNASPESYRAYALSARPSAPRPAAPIGGKLRYAARWTAVVPGIDLRATFLCGDRLVVGGRREIACLERASGEILWRRPATRAVSVPTPGGLARLHADGSIHVHDYGTGEITLEAEVAPRRGSAPAGTVVHAPGLPKLLVVTEGERHLSAIDLVSGQALWRHSLRRASACRLRRAGRLLLATSDDATLTAIDIPTGEVAWRLRERRPFAFAPAVDHDTVFALAVGAGARLLGLDAWSGEVRFEAELPPGPAPAHTPLVAADTVAVLTRDERGLGVVGFDRATGRERYARAPGITPREAAWLVVDDRLVANTEAGELVGLDVTTGETAFRVELPRGIDDATPARLEPVLRSGALFVPQRDVHVVRPRDGVLLGTIETDLVPDLLRVDERCDVYAAEESGHLGAFGGGPRLRLVQ